MLGDKSTHAPKISVPLTTSPNILSSSYPSQKSIDLKNHHSLLSLIILPLSHHSPKHLPPNFFHPLFIPITPVIQSNPPKRSQKH